MAGDEKELRRWVSSRLHDLLGFSESTVAQFVLSVAKKHSNAESLAAVLKQQGEYNLHEYRALACTNM